MGEHPCRSVISVKLLCNSIEIRLRHGCSPVNSLHIFRTPFPKNTSGGLLWRTQNKYLRSNRLSYSINTYNIHLRYLKMNVFLFKSSKTWWKWHLNVRSFHNKISTRKIIERTKWYMLRSIFMGTLWIKFSSTISDNNPCLPNPCKFGGTCHQLGGTAFQCYCQARYRGEFCESKCEKW